MYHRARLGHNLTEVTSLNDDIADARKWADAAEEETMMPTDGFEDRLRELESEVAGEKLVTRHVLEQNRRNIDNLLALKADIGTVKLDLGTITARIDYLAGDVAQIHAAVVGHTTVLNVLVQDVGLLRTAQNALAQDVAQEFRTMRTTLNEHTQTLNEHSREFSAIRTTLDALAQNVAAILSALAPRAPLPGHP